MYIHDHVGGTITNGGIGMSGTVVEELCDGKVCALGSAGLFVGNGAEGHEDGDINTAGIVEDGPDDLLNAGDTMFVKGWGVVMGYGKLGCFAVLFWGALIWAVLGFGRCCVFVSLQHPWDIFWHADVKIFLLVVPLQLDATVQSAILILCQFVMFFQN